MKRKVVCMTRWQRSFIGLGTAFPLRRTISVPELAKLKIGIKRKMIHSDSGRSVEIFLHHLRQKKRTSQMTTWTMRRYVMTQWLNLGSIFVKSLSIIRQEKRIENSQISKKSFFFRFFG